jgi:hypothetical protein
MRQAIAVDPSGTVYTFVDGDKQPTHIASRILYNALASRGWPVTHCFIANSLITSLKEGTLGIEEPHALKLPDAALDKPALVCEWGRDHVIADGNHRLWRRWKRGDEDFPAYVVPEKVWRHFVVLDIPGSGEDWDRFNREAQVRTPQMERLLKLLTGGR